MAYTKKQFIEDVKKEAVALRKNATKEELGRLDLYSFNADLKDRCVYGQMTGNCASPRACELIWACCKRYIDAKDDDYSTDIDEYKELRKFINGNMPPRVNTLSDFEKTRGESMDENIDYFSAIEGYILLHDAKHANLIAYLKGERNDLVL